MKTLTVVATFTAVALLVFGLAACAPQAAPLESATTGQEPTSQPLTPTQNPAAGFSAAISCSQVIPPDEVDLLLNRLPYTLSEEAAPGGTSCTWQYTSSSGQPGRFQLWVGVGATSQAAWESARKTEVAALPPGLAVIQIDGLGDENYAWSGQPGGQQVVYARRGSQVLSLHFQPADILYLANESGIIDTCERVFSRLAP